MTQYGVAPDVQARLLDAALRGELPLSDVEGSVPVKVKKIKEADGSRSEVSTYADGSINVVTKEKATQVVPGMVTPQAVTACTYRSGSGYASYTGCKVHYRSTIISYGMYANFTITSSYDQIDSLYGFFQEYVIGHTMDSHSETIINKVEDPGVPAHGQLAIRYNVLGSVGGQINKGLRLKVGNNTYWQENS